MALTGTIHPPGGATAVLAVSDPILRALGWNLLPLIAISCSIMIAVACIMGNIFRRYPIWWWTVGKCGTRWEKSPSIEDVEQAQIKEEMFTKRGSSVATKSSIRDSKHFELHEAQVLVSRHGVLYPPHLNLSEEELTVLEALAARLHNR